MKSLYLLIAFLAVSFTMNAQTTVEKTASTPVVTVTVEQTAERMCRCADEHQIPTIAQKYNNATTEEAKSQIKSELGIAARQMHICMNITEIQQSARNLPHEQRVQFEDAVQKKIMETCPQVAVALQTFR